MLAALRRVDRSRRRVGGVERACACPDRSNTIARRMAVRCSRRTGGLGGSDPPKMPKGGSKDQKNKKKKHTIPLDH